VRYDAPSRGAEETDVARDPDNLALSNTTSRTGETVQTLFDLVSSDVTRQDQEVVELPLLLPRWQAVELEAAARRRGMTTGQMIRRVIGDMLASQPALAKS
jgi:hypothetical protein